MFVTAPSPAQLEALQRQDGICQPVGDCCRPCSVSAALQRIVDHLGRATPRDVYEIFLLPHEVADGDKLRRAFEAQGWHAQVLLMGDNFDAPTLVLRRTPEGGG